MFTLNNVSLETTLCVFGKHRMHLSPLKKKKKKKFKILCLPFSQQKKHCLHMIHNDVNIFFASLPLEIAYLNALDTM